MTKNEKMNDVAMSMAFLSLLVAAYVYVVTQHKEDLILLLEAM